VSTEPRTVIVNVLVTKPLEIDEPNWCAGQHDGAQFKVDVTHDGPEISAQFDTPHGPVDYLSARITHAPYGELAPELLPTVAVVIDGEAASLDPDQVRAFTAATRQHLEALDAMADECERIRQSEGP